MTHTDRHSDFPPSREDVIAELTEKHFGEKQAEKLVRDRFKAAVKNLYSVYDTLHTHYGWPHDVRKLPVEMPGVNPYGDRPDPDKPEPPVPYVIEFKHHDDDVAIESINDLFFDDNRRAFNEDALTHVRKNRLHELGKAAQLLDPMEAHFASSLAGTRATIVRVAEALEKSHPKEPTPEGGIEDIADAGLISARLTMQWEREAVQELRAAGKGAAR